MKNNLEEMSLDDLQKLVAAAEEKIGERKSESIKKLASKWSKEASELGVTVDEVIGVRPSRIIRGKQKVRRLTLSGDKSKVYTKGPYPKWLREIRDSKKVETLEELIKMGILVEASD